MSSEQLSARLYALALKIVTLVRGLPRELAAVEIGRQLIRSGTSIAANYEEAVGAFSKNDFTYKLNTAFKEARETHLWLRLLKDSTIVTEGDIAPLLAESQEVRNMLGKGVRTAKTRKDRVETGKAD